MYHSVNYGDYNSWDEWFLIPSERPSIAIPEINAPYDDFKDGLGAVDLDLLTDEGADLVSRSGSHNWIIDNDHREWYQTYSDVLTKIHGKKMKVWLEDEPAFYYYGRVSVKDFKSEANNSTFSVDYLFEPYKYSREEKVETFSLNSTEGTGKTISNRGIAVTPVIAKVIPRQDATTLTINGLARSRVTGKTEAITIKNVYQGWVYTIDGVNNLVTRNNQNVFSKEVELWNFPSLKPGNNVISVTSGETTILGGVDIEIRYNERYL